MEICLFADWKMEWNLHGGTIVTGTAAGDLSGFTLTLEGMEETAAPFITSTLVTAGTQGSQINPTA
jgi:hypothetical protein